MEFEQARDKLVEEYKKSGFGIEEVSDKSIIILYSRRPGSSYQFRLLVTEQSILNYKSFLDIADSFQVLDVPCGICSPTYREQMLTSVIFRTDSIAFTNEHDTNDLKIELGEASLTFVNYFRFDSTYLELCMDRVTRGGGKHYGHRNPIDIDLLFFKPLTIKVFNIPSTKISDAVKQTTSLIENCLFHLDYLNRRRFGLANQWPTSHRKQIENSFIRVKRFTRNKHFSLPRSIFNEDLLKYYQLGSSTEGFPNLQFLAYYQILEYVFVQVTEEELYAKLRSAMSDPQFGLEIKNLDLIIKIVEKYRVNNTKEDEMLKNVIKKFIDLDDFRDYIKGQDEDKAGIYTKKSRKLFGEDMKINLNVDDAQFIGNIAKIIYTIRNALVHSSDRRNRDDRHIPFSEGTTMLGDYIPLVKFLAEKVIMSTGKPR